MMETHHCHAELRILKRERCGLCCQPLRGQPCEHTDEHGKVHQECLRIYREQAS